MKKLYQFAVIFLMLACLTGCRVSLEQETPTTLPEQTTVPVQATTQPRQEEPTVNPNESEIDFSEFETTPDMTEPIQTEPEATKPQAKPDSTQPEETEPEATQPEETEPAESLPPAYENDGYHSQIVRP